MTLDGIPPGPEMEAVFGRWLQIATTIGRLVSLLHLPGHQQASAVIGALLALNDAENETDQIALLKSIKADTAALRVGPLKEALRSIGDAQRVGPADSSWETFIRRAEDKLSEARELVSSQQEEALVELNLGIVWLAMDHRGNASHHLDLSAAAATRVVDLYARKASYALDDARPSPVRPRISRNGAEAIAGAAILLSFGAATYPGVAALRVKIATERRACNDLKDFIGFHNLIQRTASGVAGETKPQYLVLDGPRRLKTRENRAVRRGATTFAKPEYTLRLVQN